MDDSVDEPEKSEADEARDLLKAHKLIRDDHLKQVIGFRAGNLHTFRDGREVPSAQAALEHEQQAARSNEMIRDIEASLPDDDDDWES